MLQQALQTHHAVHSASPPNAAPTQTSLVDSLSRKGFASKPGMQLHTDSLKHRGTGTQRKVEPLKHGVKRKSGGLANSLSTQERMISYPALHTMQAEKENSAPLMSYMPLRNSTDNLATTALFYEDDFDSDVDLDVEDPSAKTTLPSLASNMGTYVNPSPKFEYEYSNAEPDSSAPIPWSLSPLDHFRTPQTPQPTRTKRSTLPWLTDNPSNTIHNAEDDMEEMEEIANPKNSKKRKSVESEEAISTPAPKASLSRYAWNTTASALKQQQKTFREQAKAQAQVKAMDFVNNDTDTAVKRRKQRAVPRIFLSEEQQNVLSLVVEDKKSVFFTGSAGTGKSVLLKEIIAGLRRRFIREPDRVAVTASTGLAACNIGGVTLHSFAGIGLGKEPAEDLVKKIRRNAKARQRWLRTKVLVMDEVSMVDGDMFDKLEQIARTIRNNGRPFGGIQLVITGDFFQLPPVPESGRQSKFAFDAGTWTTSIEHTIGLHHVFRQKDPVFAAMLNEMREGKLTPESISIFKRLERPLPTADDSIEATELFPTRQEVDRANTVRMQQLHGNTFSFDARDGGTIKNKEHRDQLLQNCMVPSQVHLKKGSQVMLVKNMDDTLVNGSLGKVTGFMTEHMFAIYKEDEESFLDSGPSASAMKSEMMKASFGLNTGQVYPLVRFTIADGTTRDLLCKREDWKVELPNGEVQASRSQIPLILAWALSIHKAQGQTLERVRVDLGKVFEKGQAYVALSRATSMAGLQILRFDPRKVIAHEKVRSFYSSLSRAEQVEGKGVKGVKGVKETGVRGMLSKMGK